MKEFNEYMRAREKRHGNSARPTTSIPFYGEKNWMGWKLGSVILVGGVKAVIVDVLRDKLTLSFKDTGGRSTIDKIVFSQWAKNGFARMI